MNRVPLILLALTGIAHAQDTAFSAANFRGSIVLNGNQWLTVGGNPVQFPIPVSGWTATRIPELPIADGVTTSAWYETPFYLPASAGVAGRRWFIDVGQIGHYGAFYINGVYAGQSYGQYAPIEVEITGLLNFGSINTISIYVHNSDSIYARPGGITEPSCTPPYLPNCGGASYRPSGSSASARNWVGITGDVKMVWRPATYATVQTFASWRNQTVSASVTANGPGASGASAQITDLNGNLITSIPFSSFGPGSLILTTSWPTTAPWWNIGQPHLYWLTTTLLDANGATLDTVRTRFGPREAYVAGGIYYINGVKPFLVGDYMVPADSDRVDMVNRPDELAFYFGTVLEASGVNTIVNHWNPLSETELNLADELGFAVIAAMYCNGATAYEDQIDSVAGWQTWMQGQAQAWVLAQQNHPSVVMLRPIDVVPVHISQPTFFGLIKSAAAPLDSQNLPWGDGTDLAYYSSNFSTNTSAYNPTWTSQQTKPQFIKELYGSVNGSGSLVQWSAWWTAALTSGGNGMIAQEVYFWQGTIWTPAYTTGSGLGTEPANSGGVPNWQTGQWTPSVLSAAWSSYGYGFSTVPSQGAYFIGPLNQTPNSAAFLLSDNDPVGVLADYQGAQFNPLWTGSATLDWVGPSGEQTLAVNVPALP